MDKRRGLLTKVKDVRHTVKFERNNTDYILT